MMIATPAPTGATPMPAAPAAAPTPPAATPGAPPAGAPPAGAGAGPPKVPGSGPAPDPAAEKAAVIDKLLKTSATDAIAQVDSHLAKIAALTVGGGTPEGTQGAKVASALLTDSSMMLQHAHMKTLEQIRNLAGELHVKLMSSAAGLAYMGGQVAIAGQSKQPVKMAEVAAGPIAETKATMAEVITALGATAKPPAAGGGTPAAPAAQATPATPAAPAPPTIPNPAAGNQPAAPNGNTGVAGPIVNPTPKTV